MAVLDKTLVVELCGGLAGPWCGLQLADGGASVVKVEPLAGDPLRKLGPALKGHSPDSSGFLALNRDKQSIALDYSSSEGYVVLQKLVKKADVLVEDLGSTRAQELKCTYNRFQRLNPRLIHCSITPCGEKGPYAHLPASELEIQGMAGSMWFLGKLGQPPVRVAADIASSAAASMAMVGITAAFYWRLLHGEGQRVSVSLLGSLLSLYSYWMADFSDPDNYSGGAMDPYCEPETGYRTKDKPILFGFVGRKEDRKAPWQRFCQAVGLAELLNDPFIRENGAGMVGVGQDAQDMKPVLETAMVNLTSDELMKILWGAGGAGAPYMSYNDLFGKTLHLQVEATGVIERVPHPDGGDMRAVITPWARQGTLGISRHAAAPRLGQHTDEILKSIGYTQADVEALRRKGVVK